MRTRVDRRPAQPARSWGADLPRQWTAVRQRALITGGESGIGRAVAIAFAREGAYVVIVHLPEEDEDARQTLDLVQAAGRKGLAISGDLRDERFCAAVIERTVTELGGSTCW